MKAIAIDNSTTIVADKPYPCIRLYADSAISRDVTPLFVPDIPVAWQSEVCLAVRIVRLGKNIAEKFALRYIDAIGLVNVLDIAPEDEASAEFAASGALQILDGVITTGRWIEIDTATTTEINVEVCGETAIYDIKELDIERHVSLVSQLATLKTGDIIILRYTAITVPLAVNTHIQGKIDGEACLTIKVK